MENATTAEQDVFTQRFIRDALMAAERWHVSPLEAACEAACQAAFDLSGMDEGEVDVVIDYSIADELDDSCPTTPIELTDDELRELSEAYESYDDDTEVVPAQEIQAIVDMTVRDSRRTSRFEVAELERLLERERAERAAVLSVASGSSR